MQDEASPIRRRDLLSLIGAMAGSAAMYHAMTSLGFASESRYQGPIRLQGDPKGASVVRGGRAEDRQRFLRALPVHGDQGPEPRLLLRLDPIGLKAEGFTSVDAALKSILSQHGGAARRVLICGCSSTPLAM